MPGPARFQRRGDPANNGFRDVGHKLVRLVDAFARSLHRVGNVGAVHHASAVEGAEPPLPRRRREPPRGHEAHAVTWREFVGQEAVRQ